MADTGFVLAGTGANNADAGNAAWTNPGNITASDNSRVDSANYAPTQTTQYLHGTNFGFSIPDGATIDGIEVRVEKHETESGGAAFNIQDHTIQLIKGGTRSGDNNADTSTEWPASDANFDYGGAANLWSLTLTSTDINASSFGVAVRAKATGDDDGEAHVDAIWIKVHYTAGGSLDQDSYRWRNDDGSESAATWKAAANADPSSIDIDENVRLRFLVQEDAGIAKADQTFKLQYRLNGGTWTAVNASSSVARSSASANITDGGDTTQQLGAGTFISNNDGIDEADGAAGGANLDFAGSDEAEVEYSFQLRQADLDNDDEVEFRLVDGSDAALDTYTNGGGSPFANAKAVVAGVPAAQFARPSADGSKGSWTGTPDNTDLYKNVDEVTASDTDKIISATSPSNDTIDIQLGSVTDPAVDFKHRVRYRHEAGDADPKPITLVVKLIDKSTSPETVIATWTHNNVANGFVTVTQTLTGAQADNIADYADLWLRFDANQP